MALSVALPLSGLETESFSTFSSYGLIDILGLSQSSPSPSASSESSGIGSLASLKSESINSESLPSSPQTDDKKPFVDDTDTPPKANDEDDLKIMYRGRNILNLMATLKDPKWNYSPTFLPQGNPTLFFANRSQYHRLGPYGLQTEYDMEKCKLCGFQYVVPNPVN